MSFSKTIPSLFTVLLVFLVSCTQCSASPFWYDQQGSAQPGCSVIPRSRAVPRPQFTSKEDIFRLNLQSNEQLQKFYQSHRECVAVSVFDHTWELHGTVPFSFLLILGLFDGPLNSSSQKKKKKNWLIESNWKLIMCIIYRHGRRTRTGYLCVTVAGDETSLSPSRTS